MSYSFQVRKVDGALEVSLAGAGMEQVLKQIPDGAIYVISGHTPGPDTSSISHLQVNLLVQGPGFQKLIASASGSYNTNPE